MKANKALKRLTKIEALISDVTDRYSAGVHHIGEALHEAKAAVARVKTAITSQLPSRTPKGPTAKRKQTAVKKVAVKGPTTKMAKKSMPIKKAVKETAAKKAATARKKSAVKEVVAKTPTAKSAKKNAPIKKAAKKASATKTTPAHVQKTTGPVPAPVPVRAATKPAATVSGS
jgi:hypothetical protein